MARGDFLDFGDPFDPQRRDHEGKFIDGPKPGKVLDHPDAVGLFGMAKPAKPQGVEAVGSSIHGLGRPLGAGSSGVHHGPGAGFLLGLLALVVAAVVWFGMLGHRVDLPDRPTSGPVTTREYPGSNGRYVPADNG